ncbi:ATP-binding cassette domain-containing protein [Actinomadura madurae]|uniref:ATP-binding cassette domain-containing protein n=1 Tax=Actinomadura madurae TaxID=1993 RepID=UPI0020D20B80|nr:ATP-binding cassette domain-containing protein [Actinomadura madurae]MCP9948489.1 ATP-binding cassette domain-containing protein [Actinomadura madurae]MCP9965269.1 ATP-binding cassette domain-containing protein [Actinomadura madurae]MCP9977759.1 ATP-binding cassette domain-containing protein [Actinomadura madurae]MCQ0010748.1 ATP-binding cassette domain-containing protein [Actinomadura madurae]MCQ0013946.1 ATP-binding cassette domain-containing protein [Actinomadura madurae]
MTTHRTARPPVLEVRGARKAFGRVAALNGVDLSLARQEILALLGDNGAGKSTLIKALSGVHRLDGGEISMDGAPVAFHGAADARRAGIETVYQDLAVFDNLDVLSNMFIGREHRRPRFLGSLAVLRTREMAAQWREASQRLKITIPDPRQPVGLMSGGQRQAVAVARAATFASRVVILDEPTAALGLRESRQVIDLIKELPAQGVSVILVSHNIEHVLEIADRAVILRQGRVVGEAEAVKENEHEIVSMIVGAE